MRTLVLTLLGLLLPPQAVAQSLMPEDFGRVLQWTGARCIEPMLDGQMPDMSGLRPVTAVWATVITNGAQTEADRNVLDNRLHRGLRACIVGSNSAQTQWSGEAGFADAKATIDFMADALLERGFTEPHNCEVNSLTIAAGTILEAGDVLRRLHSPITAEGRPGLTMVVELGIVSEVGEISTETREHYGPAEVAC